jgi:RHS repeat-associated protein
VNYQWDDNGNLLSDGTLSYQYNAANQLIGITGDGQNITYQYNGLGNRMQQIKNSVTTSYTIDINNPLSQVLDDGTNKYLYGNGRISQVAETQPLQGASRTGYYLPDSLGSVRQIIDASGTLQLAKSYDPYGNVLSESGEGESIFGFDGEEQDETGLVNLRARTYDPSDGRFLSRDIWMGDENQPMSYNKWLFTYANPINYIDPTGEYLWRIPSDPIYHFPIEIAYASRGGYGDMVGLNPNKQLEYTIRGAALRPDMFNSLTGDVYEIEPIYNLNELDSRQQVTDYIVSLNNMRKNGKLSGVWNGYVPYDWNGTYFHYGSEIEWGGKYREPLSIAPYLDLVADWYQDGEIAYWLEFNTLTPVLIDVLGKQHKLVPNKNLLRERGYKPLPGYAYNLSLNDVNMDLIDPSECASLIFINNLNMYFKLTHNSSEIGIPDNVISDPGKNHVLFLNYELGLVYIAESLLALGL